MEQSKISKQVETNAVLNMFVEDTIGARNTKWRKTASASMYACHVAPDEFCSRLPTRIRKTG